MSEIQKKIRTLIVDDSALVRRAMTDSLAAFPDIEVVGTAIDPYNARDQILKLKPDVMTLDIEMPRMDGLSFLRIVMERRPMPVIIVSSLTTAGSQKAMEALDLGAIDVMAKPSGSRSADSDGHRLAHMIRAAAGARLSVRSANQQPASSPHRPIANDSQAVPPTERAIKAQRAIPRSPRNLILIGASTGGTEAIAKIFRSLPPTLPGICIVQHIPAHFSKTFANRLDQISQVAVKEAVDGDIVQPGRAYIAPGGYHMILKWMGSHHSIWLNEAAPIHHQRPAVDVLFDSVNKIGSAPYSLATLLTGMGTDGATGMASLKEGQALTAAQDEKSSVVFGMPRAAIQMGAATHVLSLDEMAPFITANAPAHSGPKTVLASS